ncbi:nitrate/TMAO reductase, membrane-bound tetraheme cytochrome c subunit [Beggiatoa alba B18LD]|uniref:Nitrate/TMAO reductase, membrane-bound tetraheme cytochrome c subunit n=1 Tax=Beggiatoa alba B18LD TaxID=395493 RepID=I3CBF4_9GAMM|nr:cytochrome c family protein [Beggiatoa alba]EIJ40947.1 nitrate/TMAO reductase, membrane-bound tetraheme cytochrome c subunit [Beggiatoa alba B18LD]
MQFTHFTQFKTSLLRICVLGILLLCHCLTYANPPLDPHQLSTAVCGACHQDVFAQWQSSMHAQSTALSDPVHGGIYKEVVGSPTEEGVQLNGTYPVCLNCHAPNAALAGKTKLDNANYHEGVSCVTCHTIRQFNGIFDEKEQVLFGIQTYSLSNTHLQSPSGRYFAPELDATHPFPMEPNQTVLRTSQVCVGCHSQFHIPASEPSEQPSPTCQSCHMPKINESTYHAIAGGHSEVMIKRAVIVTLTTETVSDTLKTQVNLQNILPHHFPDGSPLRNAYLKLTAYGKTGELLWRNFQSFPPVASDDPQAFLQLVVLNDNGEVQPILPRQVTTKDVQTDTRLRPYEKRSLSYNIPSAGVTMIRAELIYNLLPQIVIDKFTELTGDLTNPVVAGIAEVRF